MVSHSYYQDTFLGTAVPREVFPRYARQAQAFLDRICQVCHVVGGEESKAMAVCAMAEAIYRHERCAGVAANTVGEVSVKYYKARSLNAELFAQAGVYLDIYRGVV